MNTVLKGNLFEDKACDIILAALNDGQLGFLPGICKSYRKPRYYGHDRKEYVNFDLSIEVWPSGADRYSHICLIECKDYNHPVNVKEIIKFVGDINSVAGKNVKGIFITTNRLQKAAKSYAESHGLMVIQVDSKGQSKMILYNTKRSKDSLQTDASAREFSEELDQLADISDYYNQSLGGVNDLGWEISLFNFLTKVLKYGPQWYQPGNQVQSTELRSAKLIEKITVDILNAFDSSILYKNKGLPMSDFMVYVSEKYSVRIVTDRPIKSDKGKKINGYIDFAEKIIHIDSNLVGSPQFNFILAHEIGHYILHSGFSMDQMVFNNLQDSEYNKALGKHALINEKHWIEWQANRFAACLLLPYKSLLAQIVLYQINNGINGHRGTIYVDHQQCNQQAFDLMQEQFSNFFGVSKATLEHRLSNLGILKFGPGGNYRRTDPNFERNSRTVGQIINKMVML
ncbi:ImmA/IrrE family metallo-endopeptidase [Mucilaginibacter flavus]|uniref:ImmA/IrrE family metallo-endopeptidase n=1 Tax=Mucilaginibacter flavus TaxID=931504 RepID=UPI0025B2E455|nr:ImmA/IrrE family metallo-endopeptidase [Mucilaginibacter flavus]MDN3581003.1 ImmA/IrrE family metallo-endopeptidase [Mucilaginibacter flavus]